MADKIKHFAAGEPNFPDRLNELVDAVNRLTEQAEAKAPEAKTAEAKPAAKRAAK